ncbi:MAG: bifunctional 5,10-methylenetetrahydrofolate dehydrogenase/5,10-methenyltetrahydrofolate cyclohydrolase [Opitutales bacterium]|nr:bifunctional 5,10-methylenetetrahydrofolate dehydrogenase/5,10-methenyltetrahydrofolate cyclohydrolase [Opitutales bacterium]
MARIIDGKIIANDILTEIKQAVDRCTRPPHVVFIRVAEDPASVIYVNRKQKVAHEVGIRSTALAFPADVTSTELLKAIDKLNRDPEVDGILVQAPLPTEAMQRAAFLALDPQKDVDGFHPYNVGLLAQEDGRGFVPCTPAGILELIRSTGQDFTGRHAVILGRSSIVGKPMGMLLMQRKPWGNATVTFCHSKTRNIVHYTRGADLLVVAIGQPHFVTADMVKPGATVIDVGINRVPDPQRSKGYRVVGDVDFEHVQEVVDFITPVPGGVGPMTIAMLMKNTLLAYQRHAGC